DADGGWRVQDARAAILRRELPAGVDGRRPDLLRHRQLWIRTARNGRARDLGIPDAKLLRRNRTELPGHSRARAQFSTLAACGSGAMTAAYSSTCRTNHRARTTACEACACEWKRIPHTRAAGSKRLS